MQTPARFAVALLAVIASTATSSATRAAEPNLFPDLRLEDFPSQPNSLRLATASSTRIRTRRAPASPARCRGTAIATN